MSCSVAVSSSATQHSFVPRKRTMSFSTPVPIPVKSARTPLRRTGSYLSLADMQAAEAAEYMQTPLYGRDGPTHNFDSSESLCIGHYDARMRKRRTTQTRSSTIHSSSAPAPKVSPPLLSFSTSRRTTPRPRTSSPLAPVRRPLPERPSLPCTKKREPDLYRTAIETRMRMSPLGRNLLNMGPRIAMSIFSATEALENMIAAQDDCDFPLSVSWVDVSQEDWEFVDRNP